jgi:glutathione synthase/RimK-type ligase-like ATP-grasp enzyme
MLATFDGSGEGVLMMQRAVSGLAVRAVSVGDEVILLERDPTRACYRDHAAEDWLPVAVADEVRRSARTMAHALGYDLCAVDMVVGEERVWLVEADNPLPALEREVIGSVAFERIVAAAVRLVVRAARASERTADRQPWAQLVGASGP